MGGCMLLALVLWIVPMFVAASIWADKGGSAGIGFLMGFALGWIGVVVAAVATPSAVVVAFDTRPQPLITGGAASKTKTCPQCAEDVKAAAKVCRFCGHTFEEEAPPKLPAAPEPQLYEGEEVIDQKPHAFGIMWGKTTDGRTVYKEDDGRGWVLYKAETTSLVPPRGY